MSFPVLAVIQVWSIQPNLIQKSKAKKNTGDVSRDDEERNRSGTEPAELSIGTDGHWASRSSPLLLLLCQDTGSHSLASSLSCSTTNERGSCGVFFSAWISCQDLTCGRSATHPLWLDWRCSGGFCAQETASLLCAPPCGLARWRTGMHMAWGEQVVSEIN